MHIYFFAEDVSCFYYVINVSVVCLLFQEVHLLYLLHCVRV